MERTDFWLIVSRIDACKWGSFYLIRWNARKQESQIKITQHGFDFLKLVHSQLIIHFRSLKCTCLRLSGVQVSCFVRWEFRKAGSTAISVKISTLPEAVCTILDKSRQFNQKWELELWHFTCQCAVWVRVDKHLCKCLYVAGRFESQLQTPWLFPSMTLCVFVFSYLTKGGLPNSGNVTDKMLFPTVHSYEDFPYCLSHVLYSSSGFSFWSSLVKGTCCIKLSSLLVSSHQEWFPSLTSFLFREVSLWRSLGQSIGSFYSLFVPQWIIVEHLLCAWHCAGHRKTLSSRQVWSLSFWSS